MRRQTHTVEVLGYPVSVNGCLDDTGWSEILPEFTRASAESEPVLTMEIVEGDVDTNSAPGSFRGERFSLDYQARTMRYALTPPGKIHPVDRMSESESWFRNAVFALTLLAQADRIPAGSGVLSGHSLMYLHASSVVTPRGALVFCGHSGAGKSTIATQLLAELPQAEYDLTTLVIDAQPGKTPVIPRVIWFAALFGDRSEAVGQEQCLIPVHGLFWLEQASAFSLSDMEPSQAASRLLAPLLEPQSHTATARRLALLKGLLTAFPCKQLGFKLDADGLKRFLEDDGML